MNADDIGAKEAAGLLMVDLSTLYRYVRTGKLPARKRAGFRLVLRRRDVLALLEPVVPSSPALRPAGEASAGHAEAMRRLAEMGVG